MNDSTQNITINQTSIICCNTDNCNTSKKWYFSKYVLVAIIIIIFLMYIFLYKLNF